MKVNRDLWTNEQWAQFHAEQRERVAADLARRLERSREQFERAERRRSGLPKRGRRA